MKNTDFIKLGMIGFPVIQSLDDFALNTHISKYTLYQLSKFSDKYYRIYDIKKKSGRKRQICQPSKKLKGLQSWILVNILNKANVSVSCKGFEKDHSTLDNAMPHKGATCILSIDLKDFFPSISSCQVYNIFSAFGYNPLISTVLTNICTSKGFLPQGSPCSPRLANLVTWKLDYRIQHFVGTKGITYTRYADDLTFSGLNPSRIAKILPTIQSIIKSEQFEINHAKTRIAGASRRKKVTGLILSDDKIGIGKKEYKKLRAKIHQMALISKKSNLKLLNEVRGWLSYLNSVDKERLEKARKYINALTEKYPNSLVAEIK